MQPRLCEWYGLCKREPSLRLGLVLRLVLADREEGGFAQRSLTLRAACLAPWQHQQTLDHLLTSSISTWA